MIMQTSLRVKRNTNQMFWDFVPPSLNAAFALPALSSYFSKNKPKKKKKKKANVSMDNTLISITGSDHNDLDTIFLEERGHYREIRVRRSSASENSREGRVVGFLLVLNGNPFISCFLISSMQAKHSTKPTQVSYVDKTRVSFDPGRVSS